MIPYQKVTPVLIKPCHLLTHGNAKQRFFGLFNDEKSFIFFFYLLKYCREKNKGEWPEKVTPEVVESMSKDARYEIIVEDTKIFKDGYLIKTGDDFEITHEFIVSAYIFCPDGDFIPLSTEHIDFSNEEKMSLFLRDEFHIKEPQAVKFFVKLAADMCKKPGVLIHRHSDLGILGRIARENDLTLELCIKWAQKSNLVVVYHETFTCDSLFFFAYLSSPVCSS